MRDAFFCIHYDHCAKAEVCLRCLIPVRHSEEEGLPCCFREKEVDKMNAFTAYAIMWVSASAAVIYCLYLTKNPWCLWLFVPMFFMSVKHSTGNEEVDNEKATKKETRKTFQKEK